MSDNHKSTFKTFYKEYTRHDFIKSTAKQLPVKRKATTDQGEPSKKQAKGNDDHMTKEGSHMINEESSSQLSTNLTSTKHLNTSMHLNRGN